mgnify:CR=1 FL=1
MKCAAVPFDNSGSGPPGTTPSFTPANDSLLFAIVPCLELFITPPAWAISDSLGGTWTEQVSAVVSADAGTQCRVFTRPVTTGASMTVTATLTAGILQAAGLSNEFDVIEVTGQDTVGSFLGLTASDTSAVTGGHSFSLGGTSDSDSLVLSFVTADGDDGAPDVDEGSGFTAIYKHNNPTPGTGWQRQSAEYQIGAISTIAWGDVTYAYTDSYVAIEIKAASGDDVLMPQIWL